jgi:WD40 repeat protein/class 3 adenylate cyclase
MLVFLFTDIEGSSKLWEEHTGAMTPVIARHDEILREQVEAAGGRITKHTGDGITAVFDGGQPVACALESQKRFAAEPWGEIGELRIRAGLHAGEAEFHPSAGTPEGDYFGPPVNATARVMSAAWGGQVLLTPEVTQASPLPPHATLLDLGEHLLKNVSAPQQLYQLVHPQLLHHEFPPPRTLSGESIRQAVDERGPQIVGLEPQSMGIALVAATLLPSLQGELDPDSGALEGNLGVLEDLGAGTLRGFVAGFAERVSARKSLPDPEIQSLLERDLQAQWQGGDEAALALRGDASRLLQAVHGVEAAMAAASGEVREELARGIADLSSQFGEFGWMLAGVQDTLAEMRARQALQLALQREQLDLQRQQLVKTNLMLNRQQTGAPVAELAEAEAVDMAPVDVDCPYKGLAAFEAQDAEYFFGREELVAELTARLAGTQFLAVVGPSGSGKSSVVRAGLLPAVWGGALPGSGEWRTMVITPGARPLNELAMRLSVLGDDRVTAMLQDLEADHRALELAVRRALADEPDQVKLLLVVDQFEEIFALCREEQERQQFIDALLYAVEAEEGRTVVVPTIRADFYGRCADYPQLAAHMSDGLLVGPMSEGEQRAAIERPAAVAGLSLEPGLADMILDDVAGEPGALPLLSHALLETFGRRRGATLTLSGYTASGGVAGAIAQTADTVYEGLEPEEQALARSIFLRLTELGEEGAQDTRRRVAPSELVRQEEEAPAVEALLRTLAGARLITTGGGPVLSGAEGTVEVAHEALIREWPRLRGWLEEDREGLRIHRHLTDAAGEWQRLGREPGELYRGARLAAAGEWAQEQGAVLNPLEREFLAASRELEEREEAEREAQRQRELEAARALATEQERRAEEQAQAAGRLRRRALLLAGAMGVAVILAVLAFFAFRQATENASAAQVASTQAVSERNAAETAQALESDQRATAVAEGWARATSQALAEDEARARATQEAIAVAEADARATAQAVAEEERAIALDQKQTTLARELAFASANSLDTNPERGLLLALEAVKAKRIVESTNAVHQALPELSVLRSLRTPGWVDDIDWNSDGTLIAMAGDLGDRIILWDVANDRQAAELAFPVTTAGKDVAFSPDDRLVAASGTTGKADLTLWDAKTGEVLHTWVSQPGTQASFEGWSGEIAFSPDGDRVAVANLDGAPQVLDVSSGAVVFRLEGHTSVADSLAWSPDGSLIATGDNYPDGEVIVWDAGTGRPLHVLEAEQIYSVAFSPDGRKLAAVGDLGILHVWDAATGEELIAPESETSGYRAVAFSQDGERVYTGGQDSSVRIWDASSGENLRILAGHTGIVAALAFSPDFRSFASAGDDGCKFWDLGPGKELFVVPAAISGAGLTLSPDGLTLVVAGPGSTINRYDAQTGEKLQPFVDVELDEGMALVGVMRFTPDGSTLVTSLSDGEVLVFDYPSGELLMTLQGHGAVVLGMDVTSDGRYLVTSGFDSKAIVWDLGDGTMVTEYTGHEGWVLGVAFTPDDQRVLSGSMDKTVQVWEPLSGELLETITATGPIGTLQITPDGKYVLAAMIDGAANIWDAESWEIQRVFPAHPSGSWGSALSADGTRWVTAGFEGSAKVWEIPSGEPVATLYGYQGNVTVVDISADGKYVYSTCWGGLAHAHVIHTDELLALAESRVSRSLTDEECQTYLHLEACPVEP